MRFPTKSVLWTINHNEEPSWLNWKSAVVLWFVCVCMHFPDSPSCSPIWGAILGYLFSNISITPVLFSATARLRVPLLWGMLHILYVCLFLCYSALADYMLFVFLPPLGIGSIFCMFCSHACFRKWLLVMPALRKRPLNLITHSLLVIAPSLLHL